MLVVILCFVALASVFLFLLYLEGERRQHDAAIYECIAKTGDLPSPVFYFAEKDYFQRVIA